MLKVLINTLLPLFGVLIFSSCSVMPSSEMSEAQFKDVSHADPTPKLNEIDAMLKNHLKEWRDMKPSVERLIAIEGELRELIEYLKESPEVVGHESEPDTMPAPILEPMSKSIQSEGNVDEESSNNLITNTKLKEDKKQLDITTSEMSDNKGFAVQLEALSTLNSLRSTWTNLTQKHSDLLSTLTPVYEQLEIKGSIFYRLKARGLSSKTQAQQLCQKLQQLNSSCMLSSNVGKTFY